MITPIHILSGSSLVNLPELEEIRSKIRTAYGSPVDVTKGKIELNTAFDGSRGQFNSTILIAQLINQAPKNRHKNIVLVDVDLFIPVLTFVFGEAQFDGTAAIVSTHRLANQFYGLPQNHELLIERVVKELIHELGHTFGLYHCRQFECVMRSSTYVEEIDMKRSGFCRDCGALVHSLTEQAPRTGDRDTSSR